MARNENLAGGYGNFCLGAGLHLSVHLQGLIIVGCTHQWVVFVADRQLLSTKQISFHRHVYTTSPRRCSNTDNSVGADGGGFLLPFPVPLPMRVIWRVYVRNISRVSQLPADDVCVRQMNDCSTIPMRVYFLSIYFNSYISSPLSRICALLYLCLHSSINVCDNICTGMFNVAGVMDLCNFTTCHYISSDLANKFSLQMQ